jgi:hypothetical protein
MLRLSPTSVSSSAMSFRRLSVLLVLIAVAVRLPARAERLVTDSAGREVAVFLAYWLLRRRQHPAVAERGVQGPLWCTRPRPETS